MQPPPSFLMCIYCWFGYFALALAHCSAFTRSAECMHFFCYFHPSTFWSATSSTARRYVEQDSASVLCRDCNVDYWFQSNFHFFFHFCIYLFIRLMFFFIHSHLYNSILLILSIIVCVYTNLCVCVLFCLFSTTRRKLLLKDLNEK